MNELARLFGLQGPSAGLVGSIISGGGPPRDPLSANDAANGTDFVASYTLEDTGVTSNPAANVVGSEAHLTVGTTSTNGGGAGGSFWFDSNDGVLWYRTVTGAFDVRMRCRIRNHAGDGANLTTAFRIFGLAVHDPLRTVFNYLHIGGGSTGAAALRIEWKTTDAVVSGSTDTSAFGAINAPDGDLDLDFRIVRDPNNLQRFVLSYRDYVAEDLLDNTGWVALTGAGIVGGVILRDNNATPNRDALGATADQAVSMPDTVRVGPVLYCNQASHDISGFVTRITMRTPTSSP